MTLEASTHRHPVVEWASRYRAVARVAWAARHEMAGPHREPEERAFLPAALQLQETPPHPAPRWAMAVIGGLVVCALGWSVLGRVDVVAVAPGRLMPNERSKVVQPLDTAVVAAVHVREGDTVQAGQLLLSLDPTAAVADRAAVASELQAARAEAARARTLLAVLEGRPLPPVDGDTDDAQTRAESADLRARLGRLQADIERREAEAATLREQAAKLKALLPLARQREADVMALVAQGFVSGHAGQDRTRERIELERDLATQQARIGEAVAAQAVARQDLSVLRADLARQWNERLARATLLQEQLTQREMKDAQRERQTRLTAPVAGTVQQLTVHAAGGVVTAAQPVMVIVPTDGALSAEVTIDNKDIAFVQPGQRAAVKLETLPFTRYGTVPAVVTRVSADAVVDPQRGAVYTATLALERDTVMADGRPVRLVPGMNLSAELQTGRRRVIEFLLSPLQGTVQQSLKER